MDSPEVLSKVPILSRVLNWKLLESEISSLFPMLKSVAMAVAASPSDVLPKTTSDELGALVAAFVEVATLVGADPDLSRVWRSRACVLRVCLR